MLDHHWRGLLLRHVPWSCGRSRPTRNCKEIQSLVDKDSLEDTEVLQSLAAAACAHTAQGQQQRTQFQQPSTTTIAKLRLEYNNSPSKSLWYGYITAHDLSLIFPKKNHPHTDTTLPPLLLWRLWVTCASRRRALRTTHKGHFGLPCVVCQTCLTKAHNFFQKMGTKLSLENSSSAFRNAKVKRKQLLFIVILSFEIVFLNWSYSSIDLDRSRRK